MMRHREADGMTERSAAINISVPTAVMMDSADLDRPDPAIAHGIARQSGQPN
jgi:hypothetical protein